TVVADEGGNLSVGERQLITIARAFIADPPILILDEATSALDGDSERAIQASIKGLSRDRTTIVIAHRLSTVRAADRIAVLIDGRVAELGTHEELLGRNGAYARMCQAASL
ncbi:MAG: ATP-binding cassette domain-containing protein, partial [Clostridiales bacterium]|nr:ATP-binding cassette domain-containing protein [Clostridiales bacterium]